MISIILKWDDRQHSARLRTGIKNMIKTEKETYRAGIMGATVLKGAATKGRMAGYFLSRVDTTESARASGLRE